MKTVFVKSEHLVLAEYGFQYVLYVKSLFIKHWVLFFLKGKVLHCVVLCCRARY